MRLGRKGLSALTLASLPLLFPLLAKGADEADLAKVGQEAPSFKVTTLDNKPFSLETCRGKVVLVHFFATSSGPCVMEMPLLDKEVWQKYKDQGLVFIAIGRQHTNDELARFQNEKKFTFPLAGDPKREVFAKYARANIPRNYLINKQGRIVYQSMGYSDDMVAEISAAVQQALENDAK